MQLVIGIALARLLLPEQFGLIGMITVFMAVSQSLLDSGFGAALIQKQDATEVDRCSIFYFNIAVGIAIAALLYGTAPWIAAFYNQPPLTSLTRAMSLIIVINSFGLIQNTILTKELNFRAMAKTTLAASLLSGGTAVALAAMGFGVWSLVIQQLSAAVFRTFFLWLINSWRPTLTFSFKSLRTMFGFGSRVMASSMLGAVFDNIYLMTIGKLFTATDLGYFARARKLQELPCQTLSWTAGRVAFPVFSSIQEDTARIKRGLKDILTLLAFVNGPVMIGMMAAARPLVLALLTDKWAPCIPYLRLLCLTGLIFPMNWFNINVLYALGRSGLCLRLGIIQKVLIVISIAATWRWGIEAMIVGQIAVSLLSFCLNTHHSGKFIGYPLREQLRDLLPYTIAPALMGVTVYAVDRVLPLGAWPLLLAEIAVGFVSYLALCHLIRLPQLARLWKAGLRRIGVATPTDTSGTDILASGRGGETNE